MIGGSDAEQFGSKARRPVGRVTESIVTTSAIHPRDRFDYWHEMTCRAFVSFECRALNPTDFKGELRSMPFAGLSLSTCSTNGLTTWRTPSRLDERTDRIFVQIQLFGTTRLSQNGRETVVSPGDLVLVDPVTANSSVYSEPSQCLIIEFRRRDFESRLGRVGPWAARRVDGSIGAGALASNFVRQLPDQASALSEPAQKQVALQTLDLITLAFAESEGGTLVHSSGRLVSHLRLKAAVEENLSNCSITCDELAAAAGISVRYANQLLDAEQTSLQRLLFSRRIAKCQAALADPAQAHRQITDIAYSWGFGDVSHFGRLFKSMVGMTPRDYRKANLKSAAAR